MDDDDFDPDQIEHGTYKGYQMHTKHKIPVDDACRLAANAYMQTWRAENPDSIKRQTRTAKMRARALAKLAALHPEEFEQLLFAEYEASQKQPDEE